MHLSLRNWNLFFVRSELTLDVVVVVFGFVSCFQKPNPNRRRGKRQEVGRSYHILEKHLASTAY